MRVAARIRTAEPSAQHTQRTGAQRQHGHRGRLPVRVAGRRLRCSDAFKGRQHPGHYTMRQGEVGVGVGWLGLVGIRTESVCATCLRAAAPAHLTAAPLPCSSCCLTPLRS